MAMKKMSYQYETSPRKIETQYKTKKKNNKKIISNKNNKKVSKKKNKANMKSEIKICVYILITFLIFLAISYRNTLISQRFAEIQTLKNDAQDIQKENEQLEMGIQNSVNLTNMEDAAKLLGMQKLDNSQKVYIQLEKKDYVEPSEEDVVIEEDTWVNKVINFFIQ